MSKREPSVLLNDIRTSIEKIQRYTAGLDEGSFLADEKTTDAVVRNLEIIGDAAKQLPGEFKKRHSAIPWLQIAGLRNRIVHDYADSAVKASQRIAFSGKRSHRAAVDHSRIRTRPLCANANFPADARGCQSISNSAFACSHGTPGLPPLRSIALRSSIRSSISSMRS